MSGGDMTTRKCIGLLAIPILFLGAASYAETVLETFEGAGPGTTPVFEATGPWRVDWEAKSDHPLLSAFYSNLYDAEKSRYLGFITQILGTGSGSKLIRHSGKFRIGVSGNDVEWKLRIVELSEEEAARLDAAPDRRRADTPVRESLRPKPTNLVAPGSFIGWNAADDGTLELVTGDGGLVQVVTFEDSCPGLMEAATVLFVTPEAGDTNVYSSILLEDGTRCFFASVVPQFR